MTEKQCSKDTCGQDQDCSTCSGPRLPPGILSEYDINAPIDDGILIWAEADDNGKIESSVYEIIGKAKELDAGRVFAVLFGDAERKLLYSDLFEYGVDTVYHIRNVVLNQYRPDDYVKAIKDVSERVKPAAILISGTVRGNELAPMVSKKTGMQYSVDLKGLDVPKVVSIIPGTFAMPERDIGRRGSAMNIPFRTE